MLISRSWLKQRPMEIPHEKMPSFRKAQLRASREADMYFNLHPPPPSLKCHLQRQAFRNTLFLKHLPVLAYFDPKGGGSGGFSSATNWSGSYHSATCSSNVSQRVFHVNQMFGPRLYSLSDIYWECLEMANTNGNLLSHLVIRNINVALIPSVD